MHEIELEGITHGGEAVGRLPDGKACFVPYALPGERVRIELVEERKRWARGRVVEILRPSPDRVTAPCPYFGQDKCGGCQLQHLAPAAQPALKRRIVTEQLARIGRMTDPPVAETVVVRPFGYRNRARFGVDAEGRLGYRRAQSHDLVPIDRCLLLTDSAQAVRDEAGDGWDGAQEVEVRADEHGGWALVVERGPRVEVQVPGEDPLHFTVEGHRFRVSPTSFFQASTEGAAVLGRLVLQAAEISPGETALDLHAGVGLFAALLADAGAKVTAIETHPSAVEDAHVNLQVGPSESRDPSSPAVEVVQADAEAYVAKLAAGGAWRDVVVLDPPRRGAGPSMMRSIAALEPRVVVYVSCDPAALARDAVALAEEGYAMTAAVPVDQFAQTAQIETVARFNRL